MISTEVGDPLTQNANLTRTEAIAAFPPHLPPTWPAAHQLRNRQ